MDEFVGAVKTKLEEHSTSLGTILEQVKYTNGRVTSLERLEIARAAKLEILKWVAGVGAASGVTSLAMPEFIHLFI